VDKEGESKRRVEKNCTFMSFIIDNFHQIRIGQRDIMGGY
jgi:hypothetical protein